MSKLFLVSVTKKLDHLRLRGCISAENSLRNILLMWIGAVFSDRPLSMYGGRYGKSENHRGESEVCPARE